MKKLLLMTTIFALGAGTAQAQNFLMNSAETINKGNFKISGFPTALLGEDGAENEWGIASRLGYGLTPSFDVEAKLAVFDGLKMYGADAEYWLVKGKTDVSLSGGLHKSDFDGGGDSTAIDLAAIASRKVADRLELYAGGSLSFESIDDADDSSFRRFYIVPGLEYRLAKDLDALAEIGIGVNDESPNYVSFGLSYYVR
jgi:outer membrane protein with beta-barrel domain